MDSGASRQSQSMVPATGNKQLHMPSEEARENSAESARLTELATRRIIDSAMDAIISVDEAQRIVAFNPAAEKAFLCAAADAMGAPLTRFLPERFRHSHEAHMLEFGASGITSRSMRSPAELAARRADGEEFPIEATISCADSGAGERLYTVILRDITQRRKTEEALIRGEKLAAVGRMAASIAHEINNPLAAATNALFLAMHTDGLPEAAREYLKTVDAELRRVANITRQSLGFYSESKACAAISVTEALDSALDVLKSQIAGKRATIVRHCEPGMFVIGIAGELRQVFANLLLNSLEAIGDRGTVAVRVSQVATGGEGERCARVTVADNGGGIPKALQTRIFEPFLTTKAATGIGLGLWVSKEIIARHNGTIRFKSVTDGSRRGSVFAVFLPAESVAETKACSANG